MTPFNPFTSRRCRDVRNAISASLPASIRAGGVEPSLAAADRLRDAGSEEAVDRWIDDRLERYRLVLSRLRSAGIAAEDLWAVAQALWDAGLYFEVHEWLEIRWRRSAGTLRDALQAWILAAGARELCSYGRTPGAGRLATRAAAALARHAGGFPARIDTDRLIQTLLSREER